MIAQLIGGPADGMEVNVSNDAYDLTYVEPRPFYVKPLAESTEVHIPEHHRYVRESVGIRFFYRGII